MFALLRLAWQGYHIVFDEWADPRTKTWILVAKPYEIITVVAIYLLFVLKWGPQWMKNRPAFNLDKIMIAYNAVQILICAHVFVMGLWVAWGWRYKWLCEPVDFSNQENALKIAGLVYEYYLLKILDLLDTVFFVLRKKLGHISFLHVYHHAGMVGLIWGAVTYMPGGHGTLVGLINSFVHVIMYSYYLLTVTVPQVKQSIWWKKYITQLQILQFFLIVVHMSAIVFMPDCDYPRWTAAFFLPQNLFMLMLFVDFYIKTYLKKPVISMTNATGQNEVNKNKENCECTKSTTTFQTLKKMK